MKVLSTKLSFKKEIIAELKNAQMKNIYGAGNTWKPGCTARITEQFTNCQCAGT